MSDHPTHEQREPATTVGAEARETEVGSVFVSNYPPYSFWRQDRVAQAELALGSRPAPDTTLGLYLHIPFCRKRCKFCYFRVFTDKNAGEIQGYVDGVLDEARRIAKRPAVAERPLRLVYFGGGTPSYISSKQLRSLVGGLQSSLPWDAVEEITFECEPGTLTERKVHTIRELGITRLSLGVESFDDTILEENGRAHLSQEIYRALPWIRDADFDQLNIDLIAGMVGESWNTWKENVRKAIDLAPDSVTIYQMELPFNTVYSKRLSGGEAVGVADWDTKRAWHEHAFEDLEQAGYEMSSAYTMVRRDRPSSFVYRDALWHGNDLVGLGVSSFSHVGGTHYQNVSNWDAYLGRLGRGELPIDRAYALTQQERLTRELILQMKLGYLESQYFQDKFGVDILDVFRAAFERLFQRKMLEIVPGGVRLTRAGLLRVDQLLPEFYAKQHQNARYT